MANYPAEFPTEQGITPTFRTSSASDTVPGGVVLDVRNTTGSPVTVTIVTPQLVAGDLAVADRTVSVPATTGEKCIFIPNNSTYVDSTGLVTVQFAASGAGITYSVLSKS